VFTEVEEVLRAGKRDGLMPVRFLLEKVPAQCQGVIAADPFLKPTTKFPNTISAADQRRLTQEITAAVVNEVLPAYLAFGNFIATSNLGGNGVQSGNSDLRPDQRQQYEISYEHHFWDKGAITLQLIHEEITDVVDLVPVKAPDGTLFDAPGNIGNGQNNQFNLDFVLPLDKLGLPNGRLHTITNFQLSSVRDPVTGENRVISAERPQDIEVAALSRHGILFANVPDAFIEEVANHTMALMLACNRKLLQTDAFVKSGAWSGGGALCCASAEPASENARTAAKTRRMTALHRPPRRPTNTSERGNKIKWL